jgi:ubiquinone/menaquinone biosynthesis C-methylase UbiE
MNKTSKLKLKEWQGKIANQRTKNRSQYPAAPSASKGVLRIYEELLIKTIGKKKNFRACVLGATPELRDLVLKHKGQLTTIDLSLEMMDKCTPLMKHNNTNREVLVMGDWLENPLADDYFDVVIGDGISNNIAFKDQNKLFNKFNRLLKKNGRLILREGTRNPKRPQQSVEEINSNYINNNDHWFDTLLNLYLYSDLSPRLYDKKTYKSYMGKLFKEIEKAYIQKRLNKKTVKTLWRFRSDITHTFMPQPLLKKIFTKHFVLLPTKQSQDFDFTKDTMTFYFAKSKN